MTHQFQTMASDDLRRSDMDLPGRDSDSIDVVAPDVERRPLPDDADCEEDINYEDDFFEEEEEEGYEGMDDYEAQILALQALSSPSKRDSLDEGYDPNETLRCVVYPDGKKVDILRDEDIPPDEEEQGERQLEDKLQDPGLEAGLIFGHTL